MDELERILKAQAEWFRKVSRELADRQEAEQLRRRGLKSAKQRLEKLKRHRAAILNRVDIAIEAEKSFIQRLEMPNF